MFLTKEEEEVKLKYLLAHDQDGHEHACKICKLYYWCPGIKAGLWCKDIYESKCPDCSGKHKKAIDRWRLDNIVACHECGDDIDFNTWNKENIPDESKRLSYFFNASVWIICAKCEASGITSGKLMKEDEFFDKHADSLGIENPNGETSKVNITDHVGLDTKRIN